MRRWRRSWPRAYAKFTGELGVCIATSGPGRVASAHRPLRRAARPSCRCSPSSASRRARRIGGHYQQEVDLAALVQGCRRRLRAAGRDARAGAPSDRPRRSASPWRDDGHRADPAQRSAGGALCEEPPREHGTVHSGVGYARPRVVPDEADLRPRRRRAQRRREGRHAGRRRRARRNRRGDRRRRPARRGRRQGAARQGRRCPTICPGSPARSACSAPSRATS